MKQLDLVQLCLENANNKYSEGPLSLLVDPEKWRGNTCEVCRGGLQRQSEIG